MLVCHMFSSHLPSIISTLPTHQPFISFCFIFHHVFVCGYVHVSTGDRKAEDSAGFPGAGSLNSCELCNIASWNQKQMLYNLCTCS